MSIHSEIIAALASVAGGRVYTQAAPEDAGSPYVVFRRVSSEPITTIHGGAPLATKSVFAFECWAEDHVDAIDLADQVSAAIRASSLDSFFVDNPGDEYDPQTDSSMEPVTIGFWH